MNSALRKHGIQPPPDHLKWCYLGHITELPPPLLHLPRLQIGHGLPFSHHLPSPPLSPYSSALRGASPKAPQAGSLMIIFVIGFEVSVTPN